MNKIKNISLSGLTLILLIQMGLVQGMPDIMFNSVSFLISTTVSFVLFFIVLFFNELLALKLLKSNNIPIFKKNIIKVFWLTSHAYIISVIILSIFVFYDSPFFNISSEINELNSIIKYILLFLFFIVNIFVVFKYTFKNNIFTFIKSLFIAIIFLPVLMALFSVPIFFPLMIIILPILFVFIPFSPFCFTIVKYIKEKKRENIDRATIIKSTMKIIINLIIIMSIIIFLFYKGVRLYKSIELNLINEGHYNFYNYEMNDELIREINEYVNDDYFSNIDDFILEDNSGKGYPLSTLEPNEVPNTELLSRVSYEKYPLLNEMSYQIYKNPDGFSARILGSHKVSEYIYYCEVCDFEGPYRDVILRKRFGANIVKINENIYHVYHIYEDD